MLALFGITLVGLGFSRSKRAKQITVAGLAHRHRFHRVLIVGVGEGDLQSHLAARDVVIALHVLGVPAGFKMAFVAKSDVHLAIKITLNVEMGVVTPPVGLNLFAVSGTSKIALPQVLKGTIPFFVGDLIVLLLVIFLPGLATWLPNQLVKSVF